MMQEHQFNAYQQYQGIERQERPFWEHGPALQLMEAKGRFGSRAVGRDLDASACQRYRCSVPVTTMSTSRLAHGEQTRRLRHLRDWHLGAIPFGHLGSVKLDLVAAYLALYDKPHARHSRIPERHRRSRLRFQRPASVSLGDQ
jgi:hypothetical protein